MQYTTAAPVFEQNNFFTFPLLHSPSNSMEKYIKKYYYARTLAPGHKRRYTADTFQHIFTH